MRIVVLLIAFNVSCACFGQEIGNYEEVINFNPPSPEAYQLTKFGDQTVNEFTGMASATIPLYVYTAGKLNLPLTLAYAGAGVKVDQLSSWVGINWTLSAGGVITRTVRDQVDELTPPQYRYMMTDQELAPYLDDLIDGGSDAEFFNIAGTAPDIDTEADIFSFNFAGQSGTFFLDKDFGPVVVKQESGMKIEIDQYTYPTKREALINFRQFIVTTADGVKYYFGGPSGCETTAMRTIANGSAANEQGQGTTSFYLTKIVHPTYGTILFEYETAVSDNLVTLTKESSKRRIVYNSQGCTNTLSTGLVNTTVISRIIGQKTLKRIYSPDTPEEIIFNASHIDFDHPQQVLHYIQATRGAATVRKIDFDYHIFTFAQTHSRHFLKLLEFNRDFADAQNGQHGQRYEQYKFEYNSPSGLPNRFSTAQDFLGYYNGQTANPNLLPNNRVFNPYNETGFANRKPSFSHAIKGTLTDIYYPTGGRTHFEYESEPLKEDVDQFYSFEAFRNRPNQTPHTFLTNSWPTLGPDGPMVYETIPITQDVVFHVRLTAGGPGLINPEDEKAVFTIKDMTNINSPVVVFSTLIGMDEELREEEYTKELLAGHKYMVEISIGAGNPVSNPNHMEAYVYFTIKSAYQEVTGQGIRVRSTTDYDENGTSSNIKRYYYRAIDDLTYEVEDLPYAQFVGKVTSGVEVGHCTCNCETGQTLFESVIAYNTLSSSSIDNYFSTRQEHPQFVSISYGGNNFEQGGVEKTFKIHDSFEGLVPITTPNPPPMVHSHKEYCTEPAHSPPGTLLGLVTKEKVFRNNGTALQKIKETNYTYNEGGVSYINNIMSVKLYAIPITYNGITQTNTLSNFFLGIHRSVVYRPQLTMLTTKDFIDPVPLGAADESIYRNITTTENYQYNSYVGQPTRITKNTSDASISMETRHYYVDAGSADTLPGDSIAPTEKTAYTDLKAANAVQQPIQSESWYNGNLISRTRTLYASMLGTNAVLDVFPQYIKTAKGANPLEPRVEFLEYNGWGSPTKVKQVSGAVFCYQYNSRGQVTLKIENYTGLVPQGEMPVDYEGNSLPPVSGFCVMNDAYPGAFVTRYHYDSLGRLIRIIDPKCKETTYEYNGLNQLKSIRDHYGNLVKSFDMNFDRY